ncbi:hypothetical protein J5N97_025001 [Dioscorea zingiberensis]|uniref:TTF-type domain-containing protein n=1 Tax=Dioscorea zingiberensis TaxID=325984 RepID=A0A9D5C8H0_9LILI|nr:hypothetical protein J5N97_025001 [Dioscorea zingiberensis]
MERYFKRKVESTIPIEEHVQSAKKSNVEIRRNVENSEKSNLEVNLAELPTDLGLRIPIMNYHANDQDEVRRRYMLKGPCQPHSHVFPLTQFGSKSRRFNPAWFKEYPTWLEYSIAKDAAFCLCCYLYKQNIGEHDSFVSKGFSNWKKKEKIQIHVGGPDSAHNYAWNKCSILMNQKQHIVTFLHNQSNKDQVEYRIRLGASVDCARFLLRQGLPFRGHDESSSSSSQGNFLELLKFMGNLKQEIKDVTLENAPKNAKLISSDIQKDIINAAATKTINMIVKDIGDALFSILVDESSDISMKEQMAVVLRYVDKKGCVIERFVGLEHVTSTIAISLKATIDRLFSRYGLSIARLRGQGYDGARTV